MTTTPHTRRRVMKLANVFTAKDALARLAALRMPSKIAYRVLKFTRKFDVEFAIVEEQRSKIIREITGAKEGENASIENGTPEMAKFFESLAPVLDTDCELELCPLSFNDLMEAVDSEEGNVLSAQDLSLLEPFFESDEKLMDNVKPDLEVVK
jgi:hypothetical protein